MMTRAIAGFVVMGVTTWAQVPMQFEVATIKPAEAIIAGSGQRVNAGVHIDSGRFVGSSLSLRDYLAAANNMRIYQIEGPEWITADRFDVNAKIPDGITVNNDTLLPMLHGLLADRFAMKLHHTTKEFPVFALVQAKGGIQAVEAPLDPLDGKGVTVGGTGSAAGTVISMGRGSVLSVGGNKITGTKFSMHVLADILGRFVDRPVVDQTGLTATYDIALDLTTEDFQALMVRSAVAAGVTLPPQALKILDTASGDSLHQSLAKHGLKLEAKKVPLDVIVVDSVNRKPTEN